jgi:hypothetical protein
MATADLPERRPENDLPSLVAMDSDNVAAVQEKVNEYKVLVAPVERAIREMQFTQGMLRARAEDEINALSPALAALSEALQISTLDLLTAPNRTQFLQDAVGRAELPVNEVRLRLMAAGDGSGDALQSLGLPAEDN